MRWIGYVATILWWSGIARSLSTVNRGHSYKITPKPCRVPGSESKEGTCMFVWECIKSEGTHVGVCVDTFMFGSCCVHNATTNAIAASSINHLHQDASSSPSAGPLRPTLAQALGNESTRPTLTSLSSFLVTDSSTARPPSRPNRPSETLQSSGGSARPHKPLPAGSARPLQKRPHAKPSSSNHKDRIQTSAASSSSSIWQKGTQSTKRPGTVSHQVTRRPTSPGHSSEKGSSQSTRKPGSPVVSQSAKRPAGVSQDTGSFQTPSHHHHHNHHHHYHHHHHHHHQGFKDKNALNTGQNALAVRLPGKEHGSADGERVRPGRPPNNQRPSESRPDDGNAADTDLTVQESVHRPNVNSVDENETGNEPHNGYNFIHTERPQWATKPVPSSKPATNFSSSRPYFSIKTTTTTTTHRPANTRPSFVSKPKPKPKPNPSSSSTAVKSTSTAGPPTYHDGGQSTDSAAGSVPQTSHWQVSTEPAFVTKQRPTPSTSARPIGLSGTDKPSVGSSQFWSENSWTPPRPSLKPHWMDNPSLVVQNGPAPFPPRPSFVKPNPTEPQGSAEFHKPLGAAHYITTSHFETSARPRPTKRTTTSTTTTSTTTTTTTTSTTASSSTTTSTTASTTTRGTTTSTTTASTTATATPTTTSGTTSSSASTITTTTAPKPDDATTVSTTEAIAKAGSVLTVSAAAESKGMQCGIPPLFPRPETRIVGGKDAPFGRWPWQVSVRRTSFFGFSSTHRCGGAVLNENWIATAGHCVDDLLTSQIRIRVGEYDFSSVQERLPYVERGVAKKVVHPKYNFFTYEYDLALVRLESSLTFAPHISPICLPATDDLLIGENATVTGWGRLSEGGTLPSVLQEVSVPIVSNDRCKSMFLRAGRHEFIPDIFLCAGYESGGQDSCQGDSGGPLQVRGKDGRYFLAGIISWGIGCAEANLPGVCTRISKFVPWILKNVT
ncbi:unnamed protein product [Xylocopa violacea]|uniref:Peptidase S1 domain-containing protein n=1 Tax=Xylocopa violacea TaxID=135666 RepID=A0ABP1NC50_XYLVO